MPATRLLLVTSAALVSSVLIACGSDAPGPQTFDHRLPDRNSGAADNGGLGGANSGATDNGGVTAACATSNATAEQLPLHMVVLLDKSGSMCEYTPNEQPRDCGNPSSKWAQMSKALSSFFASAQSKGITVSLITFSGETCSASVYTSPDTKNIALPDTNGTLDAKIDSISPGGETHTRYALDGAIQYAKTVNTSLAGKGKVAVVMATDGFPQGCTDNSISSTSTIASNAKDTVPTYVIGVGNLLDDLNAIAASGGTQKAFIVQTSNQSLVGNDFATALSSIRGKALACEYSLPQAPAGQTLDFQKVNVQYTPAGASAQTLKYSDGCADTGGWKYDNATSPTKILLCQSACDKAKADGSAKIDLVLGCQTNGAAVK